MIEFCQCGFFAQIEPPESDHDDDHDCSLGHAHDGHAHNWRDHDHPAPRNGGQSLIYR